MPLSAKATEEGAPGSALPLRSMTGYAGVRTHTSAGELTISLRSVNHRGLDLHFHHGSDVVPFENAMRDILKQALGRGHIEVRVFLSRTAAESAGLNAGLLKEYVATFQQVRDELGLKSEPDLNVFFSLPGVLDGTAEAAPLNEAFGKELAAALKSCVCELNRYREQEGRALLGQLALETEALERQAAQIAAIRSEAISHFQNRLRERLENLLGGSGISESRLIEEAALLADRSDIQEEITRLAVHAGELRRILGEGGQVGKRLDFLLQEMNRETNTMLSKTSGIGETGLTITSLALAIKANIERMREQALNLE